MRTDISKINEQTPHQDLTEGLMLFAGGTSKQFHTGEWRTRTPILDQDLCRMFTFHRDKFCVDFSICNICMEAKIRKALIMI